MNKTLLVKTVLMLMAVALTIPVFLISAQPASAAWLHLDADAKERDERP